METKQENYRVGEYYLTRNRQGYYCRTWYDEDTRQRKSTSLRTKTFEVAKAKLDAYFIENQKPTLEENLLLSKCFVEYWKHHAQHLARADTEKRNMVYWLEFFPEKMIKEIRAPEQRRFINHLIDKNYAKGTIESIFKTGSAAINWAWRNDMLLNPLPLLSPLKELKRYKRPDTERWRAMEVKEVARLIDHADRDRLIRFILLLIGTGARPEALIQLTGRQIDLAAGSIDLLQPGESQNNKYRPTVKLPSFIRAMYCQGNICTQSDQVLNLNNLRNREWSRARKAAGLDSLVVPYSIRHTVAKWLRRQSVNPWHTSAQLGHKRKGSEITEVYAASDPQYLSDALLAVEDFFCHVYQEGSRLKEFMSGCQGDMFWCELI